MVRIGDSGWLMDAPLSVFAQSRTPPRWSAPLALRQPIVYPIEEKNVCPRYVQQRPLFCETNAKLPKATRGIISPAAGRRFSGSLGHTRQTYLHAGAELWRWRNTLG